MIGATKTKGALFCATFLILMAIAATKLSAQEPEEEVSIPLWLLGNYSPDPQMAVQQIAPIVEKGMLPVGVQVIPEQRIIVLFALNTANLPISEVVIHEFRDFDTLNAEMERLLLNGLLPMGISHHSNGLFVLFVRSRLEVEAWNIVTLPRNIDTIRQIFDQQEEQGFSGWGVSVDDDETWLLFLRLRDGRIWRTAIRDYRFVVEDYSEGINRAIGEELYPWGIAVQDQDLLIQYVRPNGRDRARP